MLNAYPCSYDKSISGDKWSKINEVYRIYPRMLFNWYMSFYRKFTNDTDGRDRFKLTGQEGIPNGTIQIST